MKQRIRLLVAAHADHADQAAESAEAARARPQPTRPSGQTALSPDTESDREQAAFLSEMAPNADSGWVAVQQIRCGLKARSA